MPMPTLAESERPDDDAGTEVDVVVPEPVAELVDLNAPDVGLEMDAGESTVVLALRDPAAVDVEGWEDTIKACPSVKRLLEVLQQLSCDEPQHQVPELSGGHAIIWLPRSALPRFR